MIVVLLSILPDVSFDTGVFVLVPIPSNPVYAGPVRSLNTHRIES
jgi:hypothetical protein